MNKRGMRFSRNQFSVGIVRGEIGGAMKLQADRVAVQFGNPRSRSLIQVLTWIKGPGRARLREFFNILPEPPPYIKDGPGKKDWMANQALIHFHDVIPIEEAEAASAWNIYAIYDVMWEIIEEEGLGEI